MSRRGTERSDIKLGATKAVRQPISLAWICVVQSIVVSSALRDQSNRLGGWVLSNFLLYNCLLDKVEIQF